MSKLWRTISVAKLPCACTGISQDPSSRKRLWRHCHATSRPGGNLTARAWGHGVRAPRGGRFDTGATIREVGEEGHNEGRNDRKATHLSYIHWPEVLGSTCLFASSHGDDSGWFCLQVLPMIPFKFGFSEACKTIRGFPWGILFSKTWLTLVFFLRCVFKNFFWQMLRHILQNRNTWSFHLLCKETKEILTLACYGISHLCLWFSQVPNSYMSSIPCNMCIIVLFLLVSIGTDHHSLEDIQ